MNVKNPDLRKDEEELRSLISGSAFGAALSIPIGYIADFLGGVGFFPAEGLVRYIGGNSDTLGEFLQTLRRKKQGKSTTVAFTYVKGEVIGTLAGPILLVLFHIVAPMFNWNVYGPMGVVIAASFAHSDNAGGMIADARRRIRQTGTRHGLISFLKSPYMQGNAIFIFLSISVSLFFRVEGFEPKENFLAGIEGTLMGFSDSLGAGMYALVIYWLRNKVKRDPEINSG